MATSSVVPIKFDQNIRLNWTSLKSSSVPSVVGTRRKRESKAVPHFHGSRGKKPSGGFLTHDGGESVFFREDSDHLSCTCRVPINQQHDVSLIWLWAEALGL